MNGIIEALNVVKGILIMAKSHRLMVGDITCIVLEEGTVAVDLSNIANRYPNATEEEIQEALDDIAYTGGMVENYYNALYVESAGTKILFDAGMGKNPERSDIGQIIPSLALEGIAPEDIDIVYITHFHGDHYLGLLTDGQPTFPNARYITLDKEWDYWLDNDDEAMAQRVEGIKKIVAPLRDQFSTVSAGDSIAEGVSVMAIPGHTMGQSAIKIESGDETLIHLVDLLHHTAQFKFPNWHFVWDTDGDLGVETRRAQLGNAANRNMLVMFYHLPYPALGHVERHDGAFQWLPLSE